MAAQSFLWLQQAGLLSAAVLRLLTVVAYSWSLGSTSKAFSSCGSWGRFAITMKSSLTRDKPTHLPGIGRQFLNHWTTREVLNFTS